MPDITKVAGEVSCSGSLLLLAEEGGEGVEKMRRWICSEDQRCWCWRLWRVWSVAEDTGSVVGLRGVEEIRVDTAERGGGGGAFCDIEVAILVDMSVVVV